MELKLPLDIIYLHRLSAWPHFSWIFTLHPTWTYFSQKCPTLHTFWLKSAGGVKKWAFFPCVVLTLNEIHFCMATLPQKFVVHFTSNLLHL